MKVSELMKALERIKERCQNDDPELRINCGQDYFTVDVVRLSSIVYVNGTSVCNQAFMDLKRRA